jgi:hypothetical protein
MAMATTTWRPHETHGELETRDKNRLPDSVFAFPGKRKEPLTDARHVRNAIARFDQVDDVTDAERDQAFANIKKAAKHYDVDMTESSWRELGKPSTTGSNRNKGRRQS